MEYQERAITAAGKEEIIYPADREQASNAYLMAIIAVIAGLPLPIINVIASLIYWASQRKSAYFVRWHALQALLAQCIMMPFNAIGFAWFASIVISHEDKPNLAFGIYITLVVFLNIVEFFLVVITAARVRKGEDVRFFIISGLCDSMTRKKSLDPYRI